MPVRYYRGTTFYVCDNCRRSMKLYSEVGYDGPKDRSDASGDLLAEMELLCHQCEEERERNGTR